MSETVIEVKGLSKRYRIGLKEKKAKTLAGQLAEIITAPFENFKQLAGMTKFGVEDESVFWALKDINFSVKEGEVLGIIGRNGAGKSTLLKILSRITEPTSGEIMIKGRVSSLLEVGTGFHPELTGRENIYMNGTILGMTKREIDRKLDEIIEFSGIGKFIDTVVKFYSSGMKVRLGFSVAAHLEPEILIIDEVLAVGDIEFQKKCLGKMQNVAKSGRTVLFVSHSMASIRNLCTNCIVLNNGEVVFSGEVNDAIKVYVAQNGQSLLTNTYKKKNTQIKDFELTDAEVVGIDMTIKDQFNADEEIFIKLRFIKRQQLPGIRGYFVIKNQYDEVLIESDTFEHPPNILDALEIGEHEVILRIPSRVLPKGIFSVYLNFGNSFSPADPSYESPGDILKFEVYDTTTIRGLRRKAYTSTIIEWKKNNALTI